MGGQPLRNLLQITRAYLVVPAAGCIVVETGFGVLFAGTFFTAAAGAAGAAGEFPLLFKVVPFGEACVGDADDCANVTPANKTSEARIKLKFFMTFNVK